MLYDGLLSTNLSKTDELSRLTETYKYRNMLIPSINIYWEQNLNKHNTLILNSWVNMNTGGLTRSYVEHNEISQQDLVNIENSIRNRSWSYGFEGNYIRDWEKYGQLMVGMHYKGSSVKSVYYDYDDRKVQQIINKLYFFGEYTVPVNKFTLSAGVGGSWNQNSLDASASQSTLDFMPGFLSTGGRQTLHAGILPIATGS